MPENSGWLCSFNVVSESHLPRCFVNLTPCPLHDEAKVLRVPTAFVLLGVLRGREECYTNKCCIIGFWPLLPGVLMALVHTRFSIGERACSRKRAKMAPGRQRPSIARGPNTCCSQARSLGTAVKELTTCLKNLPGRNLQTSYKVSNYSN